MNVRHLISIIFGVLSALCLAQLASSQRPISSASKDISSPNIIDVAMNGEPDIVSAKVRNILKEAIEILNIEDYMSHSAGIVIPDSSSKMAEKRRNKFEFIRFGRK